MKRFQRILAYCPDETNDARVLEWCREISERAEPEVIHLVRVLDHFLPEFPAGITEEQFLESERKSLENEVTEALPHQNTEVRILFGNPLQNILGELADGSYDLVVMPVHDAQTRSFAERLARKSPVGVLILPSESEPRFNKILMAVDFSELNKLAIDWAKDFSGLSQRTPDLHALHVMHMPNTSRATMAIQPDSLRNAIYTTAMKNLKNFIHQHTEDPAHWTLYVEEHPLAGVQIVHEAKRHEADLIVMGAHGRGALSIALLGGASTEVIRSSNRPILVVKQKNQSLGFLRELLGLSK